MPESTKPSLKKHRRQLSRMESTMKGGARNSIVITDTHNTAQTVIAEYLEMTLIL